MNTLFSMSSEKQTEKQFSEKINTDGWRLVGISGGLNPMPLPTNRK